MRCDFVGCLRLGRCRSASLQRIRITLDGPQRICNLLKSLEEDLLVVRSRFLVSGNSLSLLSPERAPIKDRLGKRSAETPYRSAVGEATANAASAGDKVICGYRFAVATPTLALAWCISASAARKSGR